MSETGETGGAGRYARTTNGLIGSLIVTVLAVVTVVVVGSLTSNDPEVEPEPVDYLEVVRLAQESGLRFVYPQRLPEGWVATSFSVVPGARAEWGLNMLTDDDQFVGIRQEDAAVEDLLSTYVDEDFSENDPVEVDGSVASTWDGYTDTGGDQGYAAEVSGDTVLVYGSAGAEDLRMLLEQLSIDPIS